MLAGQKAKQHLDKAQAKMKRLFDRSTEFRVFSPGDQVLVLLPSPGSPFCAKFSGPYTVQRKVSEHSYIVATPDRKKSNQLCHVNLVRPYYICGAVADLKVRSVAAVATVVGNNSHISLEGEDVKVPGDSELLPHLKNLETLRNIESLVGHLSEAFKSDLVRLVAEFSCLFGNVPSRTCLGFHDVDVGDAQPVRQRFYRVPLEKRKALESEVQYMLDNGIAQPSSSRWASPCLLVKKPDGTYRFCTDY